MCFDKIPKHLNQEDIIASVREQIGSVMSIEMCDDSDYC